MTKFTTDNHEFGCEKLHPEHFKTGACAFKVIDGDKDASYWVVVPPTLSDQMTGEYKIETPNDGRVCAFCMNEQDALAVASSICIAVGVAAKGGACKKELADIAQKVAKDIGFDLDALGSEVRRLTSEGKSAEEISEILKPRMEEFCTKKPSDTKGGEW